MKREQEPTRARDGRSAGARTFEDLELGERFKSASVRVTESFMRGFAEQYDPQPIHTDPEAAKRSIFKGLVASGWQTGALTMKLMVEARMLGDTQLVGVEVDRIRFEAPVRPGDCISAEAMVIHKRPSGSADRGYVMFAVTTRRRDGQVVMTQQWTLLVPRAERHVA